MSYRDDQDALHARKGSLENDLASAKKTLAHNSDLAERAARMERELAEIEARLKGERRRLPMLDNVQIASPCTASWDEMKGDDRVRFCGHCDKNVFNLSAMTRDEAEALILATGSKLCVRIFRRPDGTVLTQDCPVGVRRKRRKQLAVALVGGGALAALASAAVALSSKPKHTLNAAPLPHTMVMGELPAPAVVAPPVVEPVPPSIPMMGEPVGMGQMALPAHSEPARPTRTPRPRR
jgi:hypothetical protein